MNQKTTYEQLITEKLDGMPVPDMADAIWARIEQQLDIDMPTDDGGSDPDPKSPTGGGWVGRAGLFAFVAALVTIFLINKNNKKQDRTIPSVRNIHRADSIQALPSSKSRPVQGTEVYSNREMKDGAPVQSKPLTSDHMINNDTTAFIPPTITSDPPKRDSVQQIATVVPPSVKQDSVKPKKTRGVTGLSDQDYKIVPASKDSSKDD